MSPAALRLELFPAGDAVPREGLAERRARRRSLPDRGAPVARALRAVPTVAPARAPVARPRRAPDGASAAGGGLTLDEVLVGVWEGLSAHRTVTCPACGEAMAPRYGAGPVPVGGRCGACRTTIA